MVVPKPKKILDISPRLRPNGGYYLSGLDASKAQAALLDCCLKFYAKESNAELEATIKALKIAHDIISELDPGNGRILFRLQMQLLGLSYGYQSEMLSPQIGEKGGSPKAAPIAQIEIGFASAAVHLLKESGTTLHDACSIAARKITNWECVTQAKQYKGATTILNWRKACAEDTLCETLRGYAYHALIDRSESASDLMQKQAYDLIDYPPLRVPTKS